MFDKSKALSAILSVESVEMPEWGGAVLVRAMTAGDRDQFEAIIHANKKGPKNFKDFRARLVAWCVRDEQGERIFVDGDIEALSRQPAALVDRVFTVAARLAGMTDSDVADLEKN